MSHVLVGSQGRGSYRGNEKADVDSRNQYSFNGAPVHLKTRNFAFGGIWGAGGGKRRWAQGGNESPVITAVRFQSFLPTG